MLHALDLSLPRTNTCIYWMYIECTSTSRKSFQNDILDELSFHCSSWIYLIPPFHDFSKELSTSQGSSTCSFRNVKFSWNFPTFFGSFLAALLIPIFSAQDRYWCTLLFSSGNTQGECCSFLQSTCCWRHFFGNFLKFTARSNGEIGAMLECHDTNKWQYQA